MKNNQGPRILFFSVAYLPFVGGAELALKETTDRIQVFEFDLITARLDRRLSSFERMGSVNVYRVGRGWVLDKYLFPFLAYFKAKKLHGQRKYQIVQAIMAFYAGLAALFFKSKYPKVKYLLTMQSGDSDLFVWLRTWFWYPLYRLIYIKADYIQAISQFLADRAKRYGYKGKIKIVSNGVDTDVFKSLKPDFDLRKRLGIEKSEKIIISASRLVKKNGLDDLIKAGQSLNFPFKIIIAGQGKDKHKLKKLVKKLRMSDKVLFLGHILNKDLPKLLSLSDVFVRPSLSEGFGNVFVEALACNLPVIGTDIGGSAIKVLVENNAALACQVKNPSDLAKKINLILEDHQLSTRLANNGYRLVLNNYGWNIIGQEMKNIYNKLLYDK